MGLGFPTGLAGRLYESFVLYIMCLTMESTEEDYWSSFEPNFQTLKVLPFTSVGEHFGLLPKKDSPSQDSPPGYDPEEFLTQDLEKEPRTQQRPRKKEGKDS
jgi:hypothetical protein